MTVGGEKPAGARRVVDGFAQYEHAPGSWKFRLLATRKHPEGIGYLVELEAEDGRPRNVRMDLRGRLAIKDRLWGRRHY